MAQISDLSEWDSAYMHLKGDLVHVYPTFGKEHELSQTCWCCPTVERGVCIHAPDN